MLLDQRRTEILQILEKEGFASHQQLSDALRASESTIRRDLEYLERFGQIRRLRGGAAYAGESLTNHEERTFQASLEKQAIGRAAAALVESGESILIDGGTTTLEMARHLVGRSLQVVTNSIPIVNLLGNQPDIELILLGGYVFPKTGVALGPLALRCLEQMHVRRLFMGTGGITDRGLFNSNTLLVEAERLMVEAAEEVIVLADSGKFGHAALAHLCELRKVHRIVTDSGLSDEWKLVLTEAGIAVTIADEVPIRTVQASLATS
jgi:DeoR/GlpR family transcriptional regulator of sugar metabolism